MEHGGNVWQGGAPGEWLDFSANLRAGGPAPWAMEVMERALYDARYYPDPRMSAARAGLAEYLGLPREMVLPTPGGAAAIDLCLACGRGRVVTEKVTFGEYARRAGVHGREWATEGAAGPGDTAVLCNPNNPTGRGLSREEVLDRHDRAVRAGAEMLVDEAFIDFCPELSVRGLAGESLMVAGSLTKILGIPGVRLGYVCASPGRIARIEEKMTPWSLGALAVAVAAELPRHKDEIRRDAVTNEGRKASLIQALEGLGARVQPSRTNFVLADFGRDMTEAVAWLRERKILVRECGSFGLGREWLRLAVKTDEENRRLAEEMARCPGMR